MSALDDIRRALTEAYGTGVVLHDLTADDLIKAVVVESDLDAEAYPGELAMLRGLVRTLRVAARQGDLAAVQQALINHAVDNANARDAASTFTTQCGNCPTTAPLPVAASSWPRTTDSTWTCPACAGPQQPTATNRRARLLHEMARGGRWKSGDVHRWYRAEGLVGLGVRAARQDLAILRESGAVVQHDEKGVRYFTVARQGARRG
ncbi:hypothetical protein ABZ330_00160 [Streptomyces sp. NPDC006172]|uniref:hypothetical protein n=1 Tax=Streptomyces sp. NPDC006172 TaxID=3154470 RepID=UPI00340A8CBE